MDRERDKDKPGTVRPVGQLQPRTKQWPPTPHGPLTPRTVRRLSWLKPSLVLFSLVVLIYEIMMTNRIGFVIRTRSNTKTNTIPIQTQNGSALEFQMKLKMHEGNGDDLEAYMSENARKSSVLRFYERFLDPDHGTKAGAPVSLLNSMKKIQHSEAETQKQQQQEEDEEREQDEKIKGLPIDQQLKLRRNAKAKAKAKSDADSSQRATNQNAPPNTTNTSTATAMSLERTSSGPDLAILDQHDITTTAAGNSAYRNAERQEDDASFADREAQEDRDADIDTGKQQDSAVQNVTRNVGFRGVSMGYDTGGNNITRITYMIYRIMKIYDARTLVDFPCNHTKHWMPALVERLEYELMHFQYHGLETGYETMLECKHAFDAQGIATSNIRFDLVAISKRMVLPKADLFFSFDGFQAWGVSAAWNILKSLRRSSIKYALFTNNPGKLNIRASEFLNVRRAPIHLNPPEKAIRNITVVDDNLADPNTIPEKVLYFYPIDKLRPGIL